MTRQAALCLYLHIVLRWRMKRQKSLMKLSKNTEIINNKNNKYSKKVSFLKVAKNHRNRLEDYLQMNMELVDPV